MNEPINTHNAVVLFGKHISELLTRIPYGYLTWGIHNNCAGLVELADKSVVPFHIAAAAEMARRGDSSHYKIADLSLHSINNFSKRYPELLISKDKGIIDIMIDLVESALKHKDPSGPEKQELADRLGLRWIIDFSTLVPTVLTMKGQIHHAID